MLEQYRYDAYGAVTIRDGTGTVLAASAYGNRFLYTGREYLAALSLYDNRNRLYSPELGRFIQPDPIGHAGDSANIYRYAGNDPINGSDPSGLDNGWAWDGDGLPPTSSYSGWGDYYPTPEPNGGTSYYSPSAGGFLTTTGGDGSYTPLITYGGGGADFGAASAVGTGSAGGGEGGGGGGIISAIGTAANIAAVVPGLNVPASLVSAGVSIFQGNYIQAGIAAAGIIPFVADFSEGARVVKGIASESKVGGLIIGKLDDLSSPIGWRIGDHTLHLPPLPPGPGRWEQNARALQNAINKGAPIRDVSPSKFGGFLDRERELLKQNGWTYDPATSLWSPQK